MTDFFDIPMWQQFFSNGGPVISVLLGVGFLLWFLILERYFYLKLEYPKTQKRDLDLWAERIDKSSWNAHKIREQLISENRLALERWVSTIKVLIAVCPLLGLLGTVTGMLGVFEIISLTGNSDAKAMGAGIYKATLPTMVGLCLALSALYFSHALQQKIRYCENSLSDHLKIFTQKPSDLDA